MSGIAIKIVRGAFEHSPTNKPRHKKVSCEVKSPVAGALLGCLKSVFMMNVFEKPLQHLTPLRGSNSAYRLRLPVW